MSAVLDARWRSGLESPDGTQIVFDASPNPKGNGDVYVMSATGGKAVNLTNNPLYNGRLGQCRLVA